MNTVPSTEQPGLDTLEAIRCAYVAVNLRAYTHPAHFKSITEDNQFLVRDLWARSTIRFSSEEARQAYLSIMRSLTKRDATLEASRQLALYQERVKNNG